MIYNVTVWEKYNQDGALQQTLYNLSDMHSAQVMHRPEELISLNNVEQEQRVLLTGAFKNLDKDDKNKILFIIEDPFSVTSQTHTKIAAYLPLYKSKAFVQPEGQRPILLAFLPEIIASHGYEVINVECRQQRLISHLFYSALVDLRGSHSPLLNSFLVNIKKLYGTNLQDCAQEFIAALETIKGYQQSDGPLLADYYREIITKLEETKPFIDLLQASSPSLFYWDMCDAAESTLLPIVINAFLLWGLCMVDANALHALYNASDKEKVYLIMGGVHSHNVSHVLPLLGYKKVATMGGDCLTDDEHEQLAMLREQLFEVNLLVPKKSVLWRDWIKDLVKKVVSKNILTTRNIIDAPKMAQFNLLNTKFSSVQPIDASCWHKITDNNNCY